MNKLVSLTALVLLAGAALAQPEAFLKARAQGQFTACKSNTKNLATALEMYASDNGGQYPVSLSKLVSSNPASAYLRMIPTCPAAGKDTYSSTYKMKNARRDKAGRIVDPKSTDTFSFHCAGPNHKAADAPADRPAYDTNQGLIDR